MKKYISLILALVILFASTAAYAKIGDLPVKSIYSDAVERVVKLGIMSEVSKGVFSPNAMVTREQFAKIIITASGLTDTAEALKGPTVFKDVDKNGANNGYINLAVSKGYLTGLADGKFHPGDSVTFAQAVTAIIKALGYTEQDIPIWPKGYVEKAKALKLVDGISLGNNDGVPRWAVALMMDRLLDTAVKGTSAAEKTFADSTGVYAKCIVLDNQKTSGKLAANQVLTDKGIYYLGGSGINLELGGQYRFVLDEDTIVSSTDNLRQQINITVLSSVNTTVTYKANGNEKKMELPDKTVYYYQGAKQNYESLKTILQTNTSIIFVKNSSGTGYEYALIYDPVYSKPEVAGAGNSSPDRIGDIDFSDNPQINKNGQIISFSQIETGNVVYEISDIWNSNRYILVLDNTVQGEITNILPNKLSPKTLQLDGVNYELGKDLDYSKVGNSPGAFKAGDDVTIMLGNDGKVADIIYTDSSDNSDYALVLNTSAVISTDLTNKGSTIYNAKLMLTDGSAKTFKLSAEPDDIKGKLVRYKQIDEETVSVEALAYTPDNTYTVDRDERRIDSAFAADNIKIFNLISNDPNRDAVARLISWNDMPNGKIQSGKIKYINKNGSFEDVNVMLLDNIFNEGYVLAVVKSFSAKISPTAKSYTYKLLIDNKEYTCNTYMPDVNNGSVVKVRVVDNVVYTSYDIRRPAAEVSEIQAIDTRRIKLNNSVYVFKNNISIYYLDSSGEYTQKGINDIKPGTKYGKISVYLDSPYSSGKVEVIVVQP